MLEREAPGNQQDAEVTTVRGDGCLSEGLPNRGRRAQATHSLQKIRSSRPLGQGVQKQAIVDSLIGNQGPKGTASALATARPKIQLSWLKFRWPSRARPE